MGGIVFALLAALCNAVSVMARHVASTAGPDRPAGLRLVGIRQAVAGTAWTGAAASRAGLAVFIAAAEPRGAEAPRSRSG